MKKNKIRKLKHRDFQITISLKNGNKIGKRSGKRKKKTKQMGGFLNRYDFAYTGRDIVNQAGKIAPDIINKANSDINKIGQDRIDQVIKNRGVEIERVAPKIIRGAMEKV